MIIIIVIFSTHIFNDLNKNHNLVIVYQLIIKKMSSINRLRQINNNTIITTNTFTNKKPNNIRTMENTEKLYDLLCI